MRPRLVVMLKEPLPGRVKTRLGREIGMTGAAFWFRHQVARLLREIADPRWHCVLAVSPDRAGLSSRVWPAQFARIPQGGGDLGARMARQLASHPGPVLIIGADIPGITRAHIAKAFAVLGRKDFVLGPAGDGGYWAIGARNLGRPLPKTLFSNTRWSTQYALADTLAILGSASHGLCATLDDVDTLDDLRRLKH